MRNLQQSANYGIQWMICFFKAYQQLKREMETKQRNKAKAVAEAPEEKPQEVIYVDIDRAAAVQVWQMTPHNMLLQFRLV